MLGIIFGFIWGIMSSKIGIGFSDAEFWLVLVAGACAATYIECQLQK